uniref:Histone H2B n=1 Tax=Zea mays TaxID=4577 RepID=B6SGC3_MAIZE|nr:histone H2B [Zea mays]
MAPKRRGNKVVGSVVKTKLVQETVEVIVADDDDGLQAEKQQVPEALALAHPTVDVSGSTVVHVVEVTAKRGRGGGGGGGRREEGKPPPEEDSAAVPVPQSQETQDPNEELELEDEEEKQPETPRVASEKRKKAGTPTKKPKAKSPRRGGGDDGGRGKKRTARRRRLGQASSGGDAGMGGVGGYRRYVWRVLKQVHPDLGVSGHAMQVLDMMMADMFERLAEEAARLSKATGRATLTSREVQSAVRLVLPGELGRHAISEGTKAISKYMSYAA